MLKPCFWGGIIASIIFMLSAAHALEQEQYDENYWTQRYKKIEAPNLIGTYKQLALLSSHVDESAPYGGESGKKIFAIYTNQIIIPTLTQFLKETQLVHKTELLNDIILGSIVNSLLDILGNSRLSIALLTNKDRSFGTKFCHSRQEMRDPINERSFPAWNRHLQFLLQNIFQKNLNDDSGNTIEPTTFLQKLNGQKCGAILVKESGTNSLCLSGEETPYHMYMGGFNVNLSEEFLSNITHESIQTYQHKITFYHASYREDIYKIIAPDIRVALLWDKREPAILKKYLARILWIMAHSSTFMRGQAAITEWLLTGLSLAHGYQLKWSDAWTSPQFPSPDQHALTTFDINVFINNFMENTKLIQHTELCANL